MEEAYLITHGFVSVIAYEFYAILLRQDGFF